MAKWMLKMNKSLFLVLFSTVLVSCQTKFIPQKTLTEVQQAVKMVFTGPFSIKKDECRAYTIVTQDANGVSSSVETDLIVLLSNLGLGEFFSDASCVIPTTFAVVNNGTASSTFYYKNSNVEIDTVTITSATLTGTTRGIVIDGPAKLALDGPAGIDTETCSLYRVVSQNPAGASTNVDTDVDVGLDDAASGNFYSDAACTTMITDTTIVSGTSFKFFYYKNDVVENVVMAAEDKAGNLTKAELDVSVDGPTKLVVTGPDAIVKGSCKMYNIESQNPSDVATAVNADTTINLSDAGSGSFYSDSSCNTFITSTTLLSGASDKDVYYKNDFSESLLITASDASANLTDGTLAVEVDEASHLAISGPTSLGAGACGTYEVITQNAGGSEIGVSANTTVHLRDSGSGEWYSDASCTNVILNVLFAQFDSRKTVYFKDNVTEVTELRANNAGLQIGRLNVNVAGATKLAIVGDTDIAVGDCEDYKAQAQNGAGTPTPVTSNTTVILSGGGFGAYYEDASCTTQVSQVTISNGTSEKMFYFKDTLPDTAILSATDLAGNLDPASLTVNVGSGSVAVLEISDGATYDYGTVTVGSTKDKTFTVSNTGSATANSIEEASGSELAAPFSFKGGSYPGTGGTCTASLNQGADCTIVVSFAPTAETTYSDSIVLSYNNGSSDVSIERAITGEGSNTGGGNGGDLDTTFGGDGIVVTNYGPRDILHGVSLQQPNNKIVVVGTVENNVGGDYDIALVRYNSNGSVDTGFGPFGSGLALLDIEGGDDVAYAGVIRSNGKIIVVGYSQDGFGTNQAMIVARFTKNGLLDTTFGGGDGYTLTQLTNDNNDSAHAVALDSSGRIVVVGRAGTMMIFARYTASGNLDASFGTSGVLSLDGIATYHSGLAVAIQADGKIVTTGYASDSNFLTAGIVTVRMNADGSADTSFDSDGIKIHAVSSGFDMGRSVVIQPNGRILIGGSSYDSSRGDYTFTLVRYLSDGNLDASFDTDGVVTTNVGTGSNIVEAIQLDSSNRIVMAGYVDRASTDLFVVARYNVDGSLDTSFSNDGYVSLNNGRAHGMMIQTDGKIVAVGESPNNFVLTRFHP